MTQNLKPFDLERALAGDPVVTRDGKKVLEIHHFKKYIETHSVYALLDNNEMYGYEINGRALDTIPHLDLFMAPKTKKLWIAVGTKPIDFTSAPTHYLTNHAYLSEKEAIEHCVLRDFQIVQIEIEDTNE